MRAHYAAMHAQEETLQRELPPALLLYHLHLKLVHSGETAESALKLDDRSFATLYTQGLQIVCDAGLVPYQRDGAFRVVLQTQGQAALLPGHEDGSIRRPRCLSGIRFKTEIAGTENIVSFCLFYLVSPREPDTIPKPGRRVSARPRCRGGRIASSGPSR